MKTETCKLYSRDFWIFLTNTIKIDHYNFELYHFKVGSFFETQCISNKSDQFLPVCMQVSIFHWNAHAKLLGLKQSEIPYQINYLYLTWVDVQTLDIYKSHTRQFALRFSIDTLWFEADDVSSEWWQVGGPIVSAKRLFAAPRLVLIYTGNTTVNYSRW